MTRITNFGKKRTYLEAGFNSDEKSVNEPMEPLQVEADPKIDSITGTRIEQPLKLKKRRKRTKMSKRDGNFGKDVGMGEQDELGSEDGGKGAVFAAGDAEGEPDSTNHTSAKKKNKLENRRQKGVVASERRRKNRINEKLAATTCFACRAKGHAAKDCSVTKTHRNDSGEVDNMKPKVLVGICYRCGSIRHTLSRCKKPTNQEDPLPFASCFVCSGKGHLAASCPQNKKKGIYPDGGCCKLCGDTFHLAKDCGLRMRSSIDSSAVLGTGHEVGADEDDFHIFKRQTIAIDRGERQLEQTRRLLRVESGAQESINAKPTPKPPIKVVYF